MRILSWNINGIRTLPQYHPWNTFKSFHEILLHLQADIICFQEMKSSRGGLDRNLAVPDPFHAFFSFPVSKGGYSGVAVYTDTRTVTPLKAEEGLSGTVQLKPPLTPDEHISHSYPSAHEMELMPDDQDISPSDLVALDAEGRALVLDFGLFVLINVYCPNETSDARLPFKMNYHFMLQERVNKLISQGREVILVGDINICATPLDHCDGHLASNAATFLDHPARTWFHNWLTPNGCMTDVVRSFWPGRKGMYTCWNTKISARETNYGTRVDYILVTHGILPWIKHGDIQPTLKGSDHCPIFIDLHDEITTPNGEKLSLRQAMAFDGSQAEPPRLAARRWDEFSGKQTLLSSFFAKGAKMTAPSPAVGDTSPDSQPPGSPSPYSSQQQAPATILSTDNAHEFPDAVLPDLAARVQDPDVIVCHSESLPFLTRTGPPPQSQARTPTPPPPPPPPPPPSLFPSEERSGDHPEAKKCVAPLKRRTTDPPAAGASSKPVKKQRRDKAKIPCTDAGSGSGRQRTLATFFQPPPPPSQSQSRRTSTFSSQLVPQGTTSKSKSQRQQRLRATAETEGCVSVSSEHHEHPPGLLSSDGDLATNCYLETDYQLALHLASSQEAEPLPLLPSLSSSIGNGSSSNSSKAAWSQLMAPIQPPTCTVHGEPAKEYTVNKPGPNKGKTFFICSRPVGPGYDKGKGDRPREEVDHQYRCSFFKWSADVKREALKKKGGTSSTSRP